MYQLQGYKAQCDAILDTLDCVLTPTFPRPVTLDELAAEPIARNADLGYYTNFMNLLDYAAVSVPCGFMPDGLPSGVTLFGRAFYRSVFAEPGRRLPARGAAAAGRRRAAGEPAACAFRRP
ncbi:allophanate hydrolase [Klebsiella aerogenes]|nr:allophanate hydrolase [Klebsiella aerogenes]